MYTIYYIRNNRMDIIKCDSLTAVNDIVKVLLEQGAVIQVVKDQNGKPLTNS